MKLVVVAVRDRAAAVFAQPFFVPAVGIAIRSFGDQINLKEANNPMVAHPEDFDLFELGVYDDATGRFESLAEPRQISIGKDCVRS